MSVTLFFPGVGLGMVFGWIIAALLVNFRLHWQGHVDGLARQGLAKALAHKSPR